MDEQYAGMRQALENAEALARKQFPDGASRQAEIDALNELKKAADQRLTVLLATPEGETTHQEVRSEPEDPRPA